MPTIVYGHARDSAGESRNFGDYARRWGLISRGDSREARVRFLGFRDRRTILSSMIDERALIRSWRCFIARKDIGLRYKYPHPLINLQ